MVMVFEVLLNAAARFNLSPWDRIFRTCKAQPDAGHERVAIGIRGCRDPKLVSDLPGMLAWEQAGFPVEKPGHG